MPDRVLDPSLCNYTPDGKRFCGKPVDGNHGRNHSYRPIEGDYGVTFEKSDMVNHPDHYGGADNPYEVIKVLEAWGLTNDAYLFNVVKYIARAGKKGAADEDLKKALWYLQRKVDQNTMRKLLPNTIEKDDPVFQRPDPGPKCVCAKMHVPGGSVYFNGTVHRLLGPCIVADEDHCLHEWSNLFCTLPRHHTQYGTEYHSNGQQTWYDGNGEHTLRADEQPGMIRPSDAS